VHALALGLGCSACVDLTGGFWRLCGIGESQGDRFGPEVGVAGERWGRATPQQWTEWPLELQGGLLHRVRLVPLAIAYKAQAAGSEQESWETSRR